MEARAIISHLEKTPRLVVSLLYGAGLRLSEAISLRVKDVDFDSGLIILIPVGYPADDAKVPNITRKELSEIMKLV